MEINLTSEIIKRKEVVWFVNDVNVSLQERMIHIASQDKSLFCGQFIDKRRLYAFYDEGKNAIGKSMIDRYMKGTEMCPECQEKAKGKSLLYCPDKF